MPATTGTMALTANTLGDFAATTSAQLAGVISDETGTIKLVFSDAPTFTTSITSPVVISAAADPADAGAIRLGNNENIAWEKAITGIDWTLGVSASDVLTTNAPFSVGTTNSITAGSYEVGAATDTTITRTGAGAIAVEGVGVVLSSRALTGGAGIAALGDLSADRTIATASDEADFLKSGALTCGASTQGKMEVHTTPLQYCDNAATPALQYAAYGDSSGNSLTGDSATAFFSAGAIELARGGTNNSLTADNGAIPYSDASKLVLLASTATASKLLLSGASAAPTWSTSTIPTSAGVVAGKYLKSDGTNYILSTGSAAGTGSCTNQFVTAENADAAPSCTTATLASAQFANQGTTTTVLHGNGAGNPSFASVGINDVSGSTGTGNFVFDTAPVLPSTVTIGTASTTTGQIILKNSSNANTLTLQAGASSASKTYTLPLTDGTNNQVMTTNGSATLSWSNKGFVVAGRNGTGITVTTYQNFYGATTTSATADNFPFPYAVVCRNLQVKIGTAPGAGNSWVITVVDGVGTQVGTLTCTISGASATTCNDSTNTSSFAAAAQGKFLMTATGTPSSTGDDAIAMECDAN